jgi:hypothetical protein
MAVDRFLTKCGYICEWDARVRSTARQEGFGRTGGAGKRIQAVAMAERIRLNMESLAVALFIAAGHVLGSTRLHPSALARIRDAQRRVAFLDL